MPVNTDEKTMIGVVGGMGPYAGIDLVKKIFDQTKVKCDQDHLPVSLVSVPHKISDRTDFLSGKSSVNPAVAIASAICTLFEQGATVMGIPCNTAHAEPIFNEIVNRIPKEIRLIHMINEVSDYIVKRYAPTGTVGVLSTTGTLMSHVYPNCLSRYGLVGIQVSEEIQIRHINTAVYDPNYGIKARSNPVKAQAKKDLYIGVEYLTGKGVEVIILGCTEIPLALTDEEVQGVPLIDATKVLARALILASSPENLLE